MKTAVLWIAAFCTACTTQAPTVVKSPESLGDRTGRLKAGEPAADFDLKIMHQDARVRLSSFRGQRPVALVFGSYT